MSQDICGADQTEPRRIDGFIEAGVKTTRRSRPQQDREPLLAFYDFPAEHWKHLRTSNPIESTSRPSLERPIERVSNKTALAMIFKLAQAAEKSWHRRAVTTSAKSHLGVKFNDEIEDVRSQAQTAAA